MWSVELAVMVTMVVINGVFAAYEIALASISVARLQVLVREGHAGAGAAQRMKQDMEGSLAVVQLGLTLCMAISAATGGAGAETKIAPVLHNLGISSGLAKVLAIALIVLPLTALMILVGELIPKIFALRNKEWVCLRLSPLMSWFASSTWPVVWLLDSSSATVMTWSERFWKPQAHGPSKSEAAELQELRAVADLARTARLIGAREENIIVGAARLSGRPVREIMLPAEHISMLNLNDSIADCLIVAHLDMHNRFPVTASPGDSQAIVGYVNFKDIVTLMRLSPQEPSLRAVVRAIQSLPDDLPISSALESLMRQHTHIALVRASMSQVVGMITLEDIIEELVGDIQDEYDLLPMHAVTSGAGWVVGGGISLIRLRDLTGIDLTTDLPASGARNLSSWVAGHRGRAIRGGEVVERDIIRVVVRKVRRQQVLEAQLSRREPDGTSPESPAGRPSQTVSTRSPTAVHKQKDG